MLEHRIHDRSGGGPVVLVLHGGPGAPGTMAPVARGLADAFRVVEPFERRGGGEPLTVARHVADLDELIGAVAPNERPALVGSSWGAMLALAYAAAHPERAGRLALIGCGTFDEASRAIHQRALDERTDEGQRRRLEALQRDPVDPDERLAAQGRALLAVHSVDLVSEDLELLTCDARGHRESWADMLRLQREGSYPQAFAAVRSPVLMLHGESDPHPGRATHGVLRRYLERLEYRSWPDCGHYPWLERGAREDFFQTLRTWLGLPPRVDALARSGGPV